MTTGDSSNILERLVTVFEADLSNLEAGFQKAATKAQTEGARIGAALGDGMKAGVGIVLTDMERVDSSVALTRQNLTLLRAEHAAGIASSSRFAAGLKDERDALRMLVGQVEKGGDAYRSLVGELANVTQELNNVSAAGQQSGGFLSGITGGLAAGAQGAGLGGFIDLIQQLGQGLSGLSDSGEETEASFGGVGDAVGNSAETIRGFVDARKEEDAATREANINQAKAALAFTVTAGAATFLATSLVASFNAAADFEQAMNTAASTTEATADQLERLKDLALSPAISKLGFDGIEAASAISELGGAGLSTTQILEGALQPTLNLSRAVGTDVATAAEVAAASLKAFNLQATDLPKVADVITTAVNGTSVKMGDFAQALAQGGSVAESSGLSFTEFTAAISFMTDKAISASDAGTSLKTFLQALTPNSKEAKAAMKDLGVEVFTAAGEFRPLGEILEDLRVAFAKLTPEQRAVTGETVFGSDAIRAMNILLAQGADGLAARTAQLDRMGAADAAAATQLGGVRSAQELFNKSLTNFRIEVGENFLPAASKMLNFATTFLGHLRDIKNAMAGLPGFGAEAFNAPKWLENTGLRESDLTADERKRVDAITQKQQAIANDAANRSSQWQNAADRGVPGAQNLADNINRAAVEQIGKLGAELIRIQAAAAQRPRTLGPDFNPDAPPVDMSTIAAESGKFGYAYISKLKDVFVNDPKVDSDCAVIAAAILKNIGVQIKSSANAGVLEKNAVAAGFQKVEGDEIRPGDMIVWTSGNGKTYGKVSGKHVGVAAGMKNGQMMVINNPGSSDTQVEAMYDKQNATVYRAPTSAFDMKGALKGDEPLIPTAAVKTGAALLAEARRILKSLETKDPDALVSAQASLKTFEDSGDRAKAALKIVREELGKTKKEVAGFGQGFDKLKTQMGRAEDYKRLSDDGAAYAKTLDGISAAALKAAAAEKAKYGETKKYDALFGLGSEAAGKARQEREALARELDKKPEASALQKEQAAEAARLAALAQAKALRARTTAQLSGIIKGGVNEEGDGARIKGAVDELKRRAELETKAGQAARKALEENAALVGKLAKETSDAAFAQAEKRQAQAAKVNEAIRRNDIDAAREALTGLETLREKDLDGAKGSATRRYAIEKQSGELIYQARKAVLDKEKLDRDADIRNGDLPAKLKKAQLETSGSTYTNALNAAKATRDGLLSESEKGITDLGVKLATTVADNVGAGLVEGVKSKRADDAMRGQLAGWSGTLGKSLFDNAIEAIRQLKTDTDVSLREFGGVTTDLNTGEDVYQTEEEIRRLGVTTEGTTEEFFNLADAIENAGSMGRDELQELIRLSGLGADAAIELWAAWNKENPVDFAAQLDAIMGAQALADRLEAAIDPVEIQSITTEIADFLASDVGKLLPDGVRDGLTVGVTGAREYADTLANLTADAITDGWERAGKAGGPVENVFQDYAAQIMGGAFDLSDSGTLRGLNEGLDEAFKKGKLTAGQLDTLRVIIDSINNAPLLITGKDSDTAALESTISAITSRIDEAQASYASGASDADAYNAVLIEQEAALFKLLVNLDKLGPAGADAAASVRLLLDATTASIDPTARLADEVGTLGQEKAAELAQAAIKLSQGLQAGTITQKEFNASAVDMLPTLDLLARSLGDGSEEGEKAAATIRAIARDLRDMGAATSEAHGKLEKLGDGFQKLSTGLSSVFKGFGAEGLGQITDGLGGIVSAASKAPGALADVRTSWAAFKKAPDGGALGGLLGSLGGIAGIAGSVIGAVGAIGDAVMNMSPAFQAWKKGLLDVAEAEKAAMGQRKVGGNNGFLNPYYDALKADAEALTTKANGGFWQQIAWQIFGGAPETMDKAASEVLQQSSIMFNEFGSSLYGTLESSLMNAFETGDWSGTEAAFEKSLNGLMARMALQAIIATSDLGDRIKGLVDARVSAMADGVISSEEQAELDGMAQGISATAKGIRSSFQAIAPTLSGYASGAQAGAGGPGGSLFGAGPGAQLGIARVELSLPDIAFRGLSDFTTLAVPEFRAGTTELRLAVSEWRAFMRGSGPPALSGLGGLT